jgi:primosomal protein N' (replication factor Y)
VSSSPAPTDRVISVAVPVPGLGLLSYRAPGSGPLAKGARVRVPLGGREVVGCITDTQAPTNPGHTLRDVIDVIDPEPFVPPDVVDLALWVGEYYASGPGAALALAMPPASREGARESFARTRVLELVPDPPASDARLGDKQRVALELLRAHPEGVPTADATAKGIGSGTVRSLVERALVRIREDVRWRDPFATSGTDGPAAWSVAGAPLQDVALTVEQADALRRLEDGLAAGVFRTMLLNGVTGSGKTELYLQLAARAVTAGRRVLVLVPEIALTPVVVGLFRSRFGDRVAIQHSGLSDGERHDQWHRIRRGEVAVVVGTRTAVFAPTEHVGVLIVDEEHDSSYKQDEAPRYHARDVAIVRARAQGALVVLGSATPSLESVQNARAGRYDEIRLRRRVMNRDLATVRIVDMREEYAAAGADVTLSRPLVAAITNRLGRGEQTMVLLNRRGYATVVFCRQCAASLECPHCSVSLTFHRTQRRVRCHYCNYATAVPRRCGACGGEFLEQLGIGTERIEADVRTAFPGARIVRIDRDTVRRRGAVTRAIDAIGRGQVDIVIGTQMIAKGHDFPGVTLVGVISADVGLGLADFRAGERTFQLLTQVVGRAGRGDHPGEAIVQTLYPGHYAIQAAAAQDYDAFYAQEMQFRTAMRYPPTVAMISVLVKGRSAEAAMADALDLVKRTRRRHPHGQVVGPAPAALAKLKDEFRAQFFVKGQQRKPMRTALLAALDERPELKRRVIVDVDPVSVL